MKLTDVIFTFYTPQGEPVGETDFTVQLVRPGYDKQVGVIQGETLYLKTNSDGTAVVSLAPSNSPYFVKVEGPDFCSQISYKFYVIESDVPVNFQDLIDRGQLNPSDLTQETIRLIIESKVIAVQAAEEAKESEVNAKASEVAAKASEDSALAAETAAKAVAMNSQGSADAALASKNAAKISETNAKTSETNAKASETAAKASQTAAKTSETNAKTNETNATTAAFNATTEAGKAAASATAAKTSETNAKASETRTTALKDSVEQTAAQVQQTKNDTEALYNQALAIGSGWSPVLKAIMDGSRAILQITDWTGGRGTKPPVGYVGPNGVVATTANALDIRGAKGVDGKSFTVNATGTLAGRSAYNSQAEGFAYLATDNGMLYLRQGAAGNWSPGIPFGKGDKGDQGDTGATGPQGIQGIQGPVGPANKLTIGTVTTGATSSATITGTAPNQILNLTLQKGDKGDKGDTGLGFTQAQYDKLDGIETGAQKNVATNLSAGTRTATTFVVNNSNGTGVTIPAASTTQAGLISSTDQVKLNGAAPLNNPSFTGTANAPTVADTDESTKIATTAYVRASMRKNGFKDILGSAVDVDTTSAAIAVPPYDSADNFPIGSRVRANNLYVSGLPADGERWMYVETVSMKTATASKLQLAYGHNSGISYVRVAPDNTAFLPWKRFMTTDGAEMSGQLGVLNQASDNNSIRAANTAFVHGAMNFYGVAQGLTDASAADRLTASGSGPTNDMNLMVGQYGGGTYTLAGTYLNGPLGASATYTGVMQITRRKYNAGSAVVMTVYQGSSTVGWVRTWNGTTWTSWEKQAFESSNVASATKLATARNITVGNTTKTFDGTADIAFTAADMGIVGQNLLFNSDFTKGMANTSALRGYTRGGSATGLSLSVVDYDPVGKYYSVARKAARIECTASNVNQYVELTTDTNLPVPALPGQVFTSSVKFRGTPGADFRTYIQFRNDTGAVIQTATSPVVASKDTWQTMELTTAVAPAGTINAHVYIGRLQRNSSSPSAMWLELAEPQFQEGSYATPYAPSTVRSNSGDGGMLISGDDFNKMVIDGDYVAWAAPNTMPNAPQTATWGTLRVVRGGNRIFQSFLLDTPPYLTWNRVSKDGGTTWTAWANTGTDLGVAYGNGQVAVTSSDGTNATISGASATQAGVMTRDDKVKLDAIEAGATRDWGQRLLNNGTDLNGLKDLGSWVCATNAAAATVLNKPDANGSRAFSVQVFASAGVTQLFTAFDRSRMWMRTWYNFTDTWSPWREFFTEDFPQTTTTTDAAGTSNTNIASTAFVQAAVSGQIAKDSSGGTITLTAAEASNIAIRLTGTLTSNLTVNIPVNIVRPYVVRCVMNMGAFKVTIRQNTTSVVDITEVNKNVPIWCDGQNVFLQDDVIRPVAIGGTGTNTSTGTGSVVLNNSPAFAGNPTTTTQGAGDSSTRVASTAFVQSAITGGLSIALSGTATTLTAAQCQNEYLRFTGAMTANHTVTFPNQVRMWLIRNDTTGNFVLNIKGSAATLLVIPKGERRTILIDGGGTAFFAEDYVTPVSEGGTGTTTSTGSGSVVLSVSPALTGTPTAPTPATTDNTTKLATTAHVQAVNMAETGAAAYALKLKTAQNFSITGGATAAVKSFDGTGAVVLDVTALDVSKATAGTLAVARGGTGSTTSTGSGAVVLATSPALAGAPTTPTAAATTNNTQIANTAFVKREVTWPGSSINLGFQAYGVESTLLTFGWTTGIEWSTTMDTTGGLAWHTYDKSIWKSRNMLLDKAGNLFVKDRVYAGTVNDRGDISAVLQRANNGSSFTTWTADLRGPAVQIEAPDRGSAYMVWRTMRPGFAHLAALQVHESADAAGTMTTLSMYGGTNQHIWYANGAYSCWGAVTAAGVVLTSDVRLKNVTGKATNALSKISQIAKIHYTMKGETESKVGFSAQSVEQVIPEAVSTRDARDHEKLYTGDTVKVVDYNAVSVYQAAAIDELHEMIKALRAEIEELKKR